MFLYDFIIDDYTNTNTSCKHVSGTVVLLHTFSNLDSLTSLFIYHQGSKTVYLYCMWMTLCLRRRVPLLPHTISALQQEFSMKDLGPLHHFLGISVERKSNGLFLAQKQYTLDIIQRAGMVDCKPCSTPVDTHAKLSAADGAQVIRP